MALDEERATLRSHPEARSPIEIVAHCAAVTRFLTALLPSDEPQPAPEEQPASSDATFTRAEALSALEMATEDFYAAVNGVSADRWGEIVTDPFGPATLLFVANLVALHLMYHDGQLNQTYVMHGDTEMHWK